MFVGKGGKRSDSKNNWAMVSGSQDSHYFHSLNAQYICQANIFRVQYRFLLVSVQFCCTSRHTESLVRFELHHKMICNELSHDFR